MRILGKISGLYPLKGRGVGVTLEVAALGEFPAKMRVQVKRPDGGTSTVEAFNQSGSGIGELKTLVLLCDSQADVKEGSILSIVE